MRILIYLVLTTVWIFGAQAQQKPNVGIYVKFEDVDNEKFVEDMTDLESLTDESDYPRLEQDTSGYFTAFFHIEKPKYVRILRNILYIKPHDTLKIHIAQSPEDSKFEIDNKGINTYLSNTPFPKDGSFIDQESLMKGQDLVHAIAAIRKEGELREKDLNRLSTDDTVFLKQEHRRITFDVLNSYFVLPWYYTYFNHIKDADSVKQITNMVDTVADKYFAEYAQDFSYKSNLQLQVFRNILPELLHRKYIASENPFNDYLKAAKISNELESIKAENDSLKAEIALLENPNYRFALNNKINKVSQVFKGNTATDFEMKSLTNEAVKLSHFKGKVILIDVWASWCGPCKKQMPIFQALQDHFKEKEDIVLISLSIDDNSQAWERSVKELKLNGHNYLIDRSRLSAYSLSSVPRTIIIDQNFNIYDATAELTSKKLIEELEKLREAKPI